MSESTQLEKAPAPAKPARGNARGRAPRPAWSEEIAGMGRAWLASWRYVLDRGNLTGDVLAGLTVGAVALPLNLALAVACGLPPIAGLIAGAIGGGVVALTGGSSLQVSGPAAALSVMVLAIAKEFGPVGVAAAALIVGVAQLGMGFALAGRVMARLPEAVVAGFTTGVGVKLLDMQIPELLGFDYQVTQLVEMMHRPAWLREVSWLAVVCGLGVAFLVVSTKPWKRFPAALVGVTIVTALANYLDWKIERVGAIPSHVPAPTLPLVPDERWVDLFAIALPLALLAAAESLISAKAVDRMTPEREPFDPNLELVGQGLGNVVTGLMGGMPVSGVVVRSSVNVQSGGRTRLAGLVHAVALLGCILFLSETIARVPLAGLAGLLCVVGVRLIEVSTFRHLWQEERHGAFAFLATLAGTVTGHLVIGLVAGVVIQVVGERLFGKPETEERPKDKRLRAVLDEKRAVARRKAHEPLVPTERRAWLSNIRERLHRPGTAFVHDQATVIGKVVLGDHVHIAAESSVRADEGSPFFIGPSSNVQDGVILHALKERHVRVDGEDWAIYVGRNVSIAHGAIVHGPCYVGDHTFIGFKAVVHDSIVGARCFIGIGAVVVGVEIPDGRFVPHGAIVDTAEKAERLPLAAHAHAEFNDDVVEVNRGLASAYQAHAAGPRPRLVRASALEGWEPPVVAADRF